MDWLMRNLTERKKDNSEAVANIQDIVSQEILIN